MANNEIIILTDDEIKKGAKGRVTNNENLNLKYKTTDTNITLQEYKIGGLYDPKIFGSANRCPCGRTNVVGVRCPVCQVKVYSDDDYITNYGYYQLSVPFVSNIKIKGLISKLKQYYNIPIKNAKQLQELWSLGIKLTPTDDTSDDTKEYVKDANGTYIIEFTDIPEDEGDPKFQYSLNHFGLFGLHYLAEFSTLTGESLKWIDSFINFNLVVVSPAIRPVSKIMTGDTPKLTFSSITINYGAIIELSETIPLLLEHDYTKLVDKLTICYAMNVCINKFLSENELLLSSKESFVRNIVDTRLSKSIRANLVSALDLEMDKIYVPEALAYKALQVDIINKLIKNLSMASEADCIKLYKTKDPKALEAFQEIIDNCMCTLVRNPSVHRFALQAYHPILWKEPAIGLPIAVDEVYNADHDGDTVYVQFHTDELKCARLLDITPDKLWFYDKTYKPYVTMKHEELYGLYKATKITEPSKGIQCFTSFEEMEKAYEAGTLEMTEHCKLNDKDTTYGRSKVTKLSGGMDIDSYTKGQPVNTKNIAKLISGIGYHENRKKEYLDLQTFGAEVSTLTTLGGAVPYSELYTGNEEDIKKILESNEPDQVKMSQINDLIANNIKNSIEKLPDCNVEDLMQGAGKVEVSKLAGVFAPALTIDNKGVYVNTNETLLNGLSERAFNNMTAQNRGTLKMKQDLVPIGGFLQRQLINVCLDLIYKDAIGSPDKVGILLKGKDAIGRTDLNGNIITSDPGHDVLVKSCINNDTNIVYADEISTRDFKNPDDPTIGRKISLKDGAYVGVAFAASVTEQMIQSGLAFKHGGALSGVDLNVLKAIESGTVVDIDDRFITIKGNHTYKYIITECTNMYDNIKINEFIQEGTPILKQYKTTKADDKIAMVNTLVQAQVVNDGEATLGAIRETSDSVYNINTGELGYNKGYLVIGDTTYKINENDLYYYPVGYNMDKKFMRMSNGIPNMNMYWNKSNKSIQDTYYIFYYHILTVYPGMNSDVFEILFKCLYKNEFSVSKSIANKDSFIDRLYYGDTKSNFTKEIQNSQVEVSNGKVTTSIKLTDSIILPMILGRKNYSGQ